MGSITRFDMPRPEPGANGKALFDVNRAFRVSRIACAVAAGPEMPNGPVSLRRARSVWFALFMAAWEAAFLPLERVLQRKLNMALGGVGVGDLDRKSTRLNSSH